MPTPTPNTHSAPLSQAGALGGQHAGGHSDVKKPVTPTDHLTGEAAAKAYAESISPKGMAAEHAMQEKALADLMKSRMKPNGAYNSKGTN